MVACGSQKGVFMNFSDVLEMNLETYANATNVTLTHLDKDGATTAVFGQTHQYCSLFAEAVGGSQLCNKVHHDSCTQALSLGESYIFLCPGALTHYTVPIMKSGIYQGSVVAGPITLDYPDITLIDTVIQKYSISLDYRRKMYTALTAVPLIEPFQARHLSKLLFLLVTNLNTEEAERIRRLNEKALQQAKIGDYAHLYEVKPHSSTLYTMEKSLIYDVISGNSKGAITTLNKMLGQIFFTSGNNIEVIKIRTVELVALLSRAVHEVSPEDNSTFQMTPDFMTAIAHINNLTDLSYVLLETLEQFTDMVFSKVSYNNLSVIKQSIAFINNHYNQSITLETVADKVGLHPTYFSTLFKKETGINFSKYILNLRIENAKLLLKNSNLSLSSIAVEIGFGNQSYFSSAFKNTTGVTPKQYRQSL